MQSGFIRSRRLLVMAPVIGVAGTAIAMIGARMSAGARRPQTPTAPLPYTQQAIGFDNPDAGLRLAGTLALPPGRGPHPVIILIPGSGPVERDGSLFGHRFYAVLADHLVRRGFAVLRSDKRGIGESGGSFDSATTHDFASDIAAAVTFLRGRRDIDNRHIGLIGHSEGALVGAMAATRVPDIRFLIMMGGNGVPGSQMLLSNLRQGALARRPQADIERELALQREAQRISIDLAQSAAREAALRALFQRAQRETGRPFTDDEIGAAASPWMHAFLRLDPQAILRRVRCPVLALIGENDRIVSARENLPALRAALAANSAASVAALPSLNHFFQTSLSGQFAEIEQIEETMSPAALRLIADWAVAHQ